jgi:hypothetical protein|tara:strand:+ start:929 stop:1690 length:762 start_codon:yes stop_codon:yes gene_type:complete
MFRRGGTVNDGIMTGLTDRKQLANGMMVDDERLGKDTQSILDAMAKYAPIPKTRLPLGQFGLNLASGKFAGDGKLQNLIGSAQGPYSQFVKADDARNMALAKRKQGAVSTALGMQLKKDKQQSVLAAEKKAKFLLPPDATADQIRAKTAEIIQSEMKGKTYGAEANLERAINSYRSQYGDGSKAFNHASFDVKVAPALRQAGKNPRSNIKFKDGKYKTKGKTPGVYIDVDNAKVIEFDGNVAVELPEFTALLK